MSEKDKERYFALRSDRYLDKTPAEFFAEVDQTVAELGMSMDVISKTINALRHDLDEAETCRAQEVHDKLDDFLVPIYIALRKKGYNDHDLWG